MAAKKSSNKLQMTLVSAEVMDLADDGRGVPQTRFFSPCKGTSQPEEVNRRKMVVAPTNISTAECENSPAVFGGKLAVEDVRESHEPSGETTCAEQRLKICEADVETLKKKIEGVLGKIEESDTVRRGQVECISERVYDAEKNLRQAEERQDEAIEKASATFQKQSSDLMHVINQVNTNFDHLTLQSKQQGVALENLKERVSQLQASTAKTTADFGRSMESVNQDCVSLEQNMHEQNQALRDMVMRMVPPAKFNEMQTLQRSLEEQLERLQFCFDAELKHQSPPIVSQSRSSERDERTQRRSSSAVPAGRSSPPQQPAIKSWTGPAYRSHFETRSGANEVEPAGEVEYTILFQDHVPTRPWDIDTMDAVCQDRGHVRRSADMPHKGDRNYPVDRAVPWQEEHRGVPDASAVPAPVIGSGSMYPL